MTDGLLRCFSIQDGQAQGIIEFDVPALRVILDHGDPDEGGPATLYWSAGSAESTFSFGIDVDERSGRIVLVELLLYGDRIQPWPSDLEGIAQREGIPVIDTNAWRSGGRTCDFAPTFRLQRKDRDLRVALSTADPVLRVSPCRVVHLEFDAEDRLNGVVFRQLDPTVLETLVARYG